ncbi:phytanoyl-CoA dioxygenase family protein [Candidatus Woesearchaeota archaeon]|nr:phytanoyl-CoA dioxygenase family protein [Candidatus Woesearchaeota archaeon]
MPLSPAEIHTFYEEGYVVVQNFFSLQEIDEMCEASERLQYLSAFLHHKIASSGVEQMEEGSKFVFTPAKYLKRVVWCGAVEQKLLDYGQSNRLTEVAAKILGSDSLDHILNQIHFKLPHDGVVYPFHQDAQHRRYGTSEWNDVNGKGSYVQTVTALDEVTLENGPLLIIPGSSRKGFLNLPYDEQKETVSELFDSADAIPLLMQPGDVLFFGPYLIHGSRENTSATPRRMFINGFAYPGANQREYVGSGKGVRIEI